MSLLSDQLLIVRKQRKMTHRQVANDLGVRKRTVEMAERGQRALRPSTRRLIEMWIARNATYKEREMINASTNT